MPTVKTLLTKRKVLHNLWFILMVCLIVAVFFLRLYRLPEYLMFLSDQGRDAIVLKRLVTLEKLVFVGPTTSIGNVFTGPFYYYLVAPFMLLSGLHPVGPAIGVALLNSMGLVGIGWFLTKKFGKVTGLIFMILAGLSATQIWQSRYSWNPNPVPLFTFLTLIAWQKAVDSRKLRYFILTGVLFGFSLQLHYITMILATPLLFTGAQKLFIQIRRHFHRHEAPRVDTRGAMNTAERNPPKQKHSSTALHPWSSAEENKTDLQDNLSLMHGLYAYFFLAGSALATFLPLIVFEIKNHFVNTQSFFRAFSTGEIQAKNSIYFDRLKDTCAGFFQHMFLTEINRDVALGLVLIVSTAVIFVVWKDKRSRAEFVLWSLLVVIANIFALSMLETGRHVHYYNPSYLLAYFIIAYMVVSIGRGIKTIFVKCRTFDTTGEFCDDDSEHGGHHTKPKTTHAYCDACTTRATQGYTHMEKAMLVCFTLVTILCLFEYSRHQISSLFFLTEKPKTNTQITHAAQVAKYIIGQVKSDEFQVVGLPFYEVEGHYRYFLEYYGHRPMPSDALGDPRELFVICHELAKPDCDIPGNPQWQIADFQNRHPNWRVESSALVEEVRVYKLVY